jgi:hypothetical protein
MNQDSPTHSARHLEEDEVIDLLHGLASPDQRRAALEHLGRCPRCERLFGDRLREREQLRAAGLPQELTTVLPRTPAARSRPARVAALVAAAAVCIATWLVVSHNHGGDAYWAPIEIEAHATRSGDPVRNERFERALAAYQRHDAAETIAILGNVSYDFPNADTADILEGLMLASAYANDGQPEDALRILELLELTTIPLPWRNRGHWIEYQSLRQLNSEPEARRLLETLAEASDEVGAMARRELARLDR